MLGMQTCSIPGCDQPTKGRGWCNRHYQRWYNHGDPLVTFNPVGEPPISRFNAMISPWVMDGCFDWMGTTTRKGYGLFWDGERMVSAHRWIYEYCQGTIPDGLQIDHLCRNRRCVNVAHLDVVTSRENQARSPYDPAKRTHCPSGHPYNEENTYVNPKGSRECRACRQRRHDAYTRKRREQRR